MNKNIASQWKAILDGLRDVKAEREAEYRYGTFERLEDQIDAKRLSDNTKKAYNDALDACLDGQDPLMWKLSYNGG